MLLSIIVSIWLIYWKLNGPPGGVLLKMGHYLSLASNSPSLSSLSSDHYQYYLVRYQ